MPLSLTAAQPRSPVLPRVGVQAMLEARSVAVVGASGRPGSPGDRILTQVTALGFAGPVYPVNPRYRSLRGLACYPALEDLPARADLVILALPGQLAETGLMAASEAGAAGAVIIANCQDKAGPSPVLSSNRLAAIARDVGLELCGPNCLGFMNARHRLVAGYFDPGQEGDGSIAWISQSGSAFLAMIGNRRGLRFGLAVSSGQELVTTAAEYLIYALSQPWIKAAALMLETVRDPHRFRAALDLACDRDVPVVIMKVGRTSRSAQLVQAHSGALAGDDGAYEALFEAYGVSRVFSLDEMADTLELFCAGRRAGPGGLAAIHDSGGERVHLADEATALRIDLPPLSSQTVSRLEAILPSGLSPGNPLDAWDSVENFEDVFGRCIAALLDDPQVAVLVIAADLAAASVIPGYLRLITAAFDATSKPVAVLGSLGTAMDPQATACLRARGVPVLMGMRTGLSAIAHLLGYGDHRDRPVIRPTVPRPARHVARWRERLARAALPDEVEALQLLADYGIRTAACLRAEDLTTAMDAASRLGWPVVLKTRKPGVSHKSDVNGVITGLGDEAAFRAAYLDMAARLGPAVTIAEMVSEGVELALGITRDRQFGPLMVVAAGGVLAELLEDRRVALPPVDASTAGRLLDGLRVTPLLSGARGRPRAPRAPITDTITAVSRIAVDLGDCIDALDINPLICSPDGCVAADALLIPSCQEDQNLSCPARRNPLHDHGYRTRP